jgi:hypothetical protein
MISRGGRGFSYRNPIYAAVAGRASLLDERSVAEFGRSGAPGIAAESRDHPIDPGSIIACFFCIGGDD